METFSMESEEKKRGNALRAFLVELLIIVLLLIAIIFTLNYFKIINLFPVKPIANRISIPQLQISPTLTPDEKINLQKTNLSKYTNTTSAVANIQYDGQIIDIRNKGNISGLDYEFALELQTQGEMKYSLYFNKDTLSKSVLMTKDGKTINEVNANSFSVGDVLTIQSQLDLKKDVGNNTIKLTITKH